MANQDIWDDLEAGLRGENLDDEMFEFISAYADGECSAKERRLVEAYLAGNAGARDLLADIRGQNSAMLADAEPPSWLRDSILERTSRRKRTFWPAAGWASAAATAAVAAWLAFPSADGPTADYAVNQPSLVAPILEQDLPRAAPPTPLAATGGPERRQPSNETRLAFLAKRPPVTKDPTPSEAPKATAPLPPAGKHVSVSYALADSRPSTEPQAPDTVSLVTSSEAETSLGATDNLIKQEGEPVLTDAREKLRDRLKKVNKDNHDIKEAVRSTTS